MFSLLEGRKGGVSLIFCLFLDILCQHLRFSIDLSSEQNDVSRGKAKKGSDLCKISAEVCDFSVFNLLLQVLP